MDKVGRQADQRSVTAVSTVVILHPVQALNFSPPGEAFIQRGRNNYRPRRNYFG